MNSKLMCFRRSSIGCLCDSAPVTTSAAASAGHAPARRESPRGSRWAAGADAAGAARHGRTWMAGAMTARFQTVGSNVRTWLPGSIPAWVSPRGLDPENEDGWYLAVVCSRRSAGAWRWGDSQHLTATRLGRVDAWPPGAVGRSVALGRRYGIHLATAGKRTVKVVPWLGTLATAMDPPWARAI